MLAALSFRAMAQRLTPLHHLIASNSMLTRPEMFRQLQLDIADRLGSIEKGVKLEILNEQMRMLRETLLSSFDARVDSLRIESTNGSVLDRLNPEDADAAIEIKFDDLKYVIPVGNRSFLASFEDAGRDFPASLQDLLAEAVERSSDGSRGMNLRLFQQVLDEALTIAINELNGNRGGGWSNQVAAMINSELQRYLRDYIRSQHSSFKSNDPEKWKDFLKKDKKALEKVLKEGAVKGITATRTLLADGLNQAESRMRGLVGEFNRVLLSADAGLSVSQEKGDLGAGIHVAYTQSSVLQMGIYLNTEFQPSDTKSARALIGGQARMAFGKMQLDLLASAIRGTGWGGEAGVGVSYSAGDAVIIGVAVFSTFNTVEVQDSTVVNGWSLGMTVRGTSESSPTLVIGASTIAHSGTGARPLFQIVYPIRPQD